MFIPTNEIISGARAALSLVCNWSSTLLHCHKFYLEFWQMIRCLIWLTCTLCPADQRGSRCSGAPLPRPGEQDTDAVLCVWLQMPNLIGKWAHTVSLCPRGLAGPVLDFPSNDWSIPYDGVSVELDDQIGRACPQELRGCNRRWGHCKEHHVIK